jgi:hypothetical protein
MLKKVVNNRKLPRIEEIREAVIRNSCIAEKTCETIIKSNGFLGKLFEPHKDDHVGLEQKTH